MTSTDKFGKLHFRSAETLLLNGGPNTLSIKSRESRLSRFKGGAIFEPFIVPYSLKYLKTVLV